MCGDPGPMGDESEFQEELRKIDSSAVVERDYFGIAVYSKAPELIKSYVPKKWYGYSVLVKHISDKPKSAYEVVVDHHNPGLCVINALDVNSFLRALKELEALANITDGSLHNLRIAVKRD